MRVIYPSAGSPRVAVRPRGFHPMACGETYTIDFPLSILLSFTVNKNKFNVSRVGASPSL
jgi:hypothetical protein